MTSSSSSSAISARLECRAKFFFEGDRKVYVKGVTYGPFRPPEGQPELFFKDRETTLRDFAQMHEMGANLIRVYHLPPEWMLDDAAAHGLRVLVTVPWEQHITFLDSDSVKKSIRAKVRQTAKSLKGHPGIFGLLVGNEIPGDIIRWHGAAPMRDFVDSLIAEAKSVDAGLLTAYACYPSTEYLLPRFADFYSYNVYLHNRTEFRNYLGRLQNLAEEKPLILGEFGLDTLRHTEEEQAQMLSWHTETVARSGLAGTIFFAWTDEWFTGGHDITDWAFGLVKQDRTPKKAYHAVQKYWAGNHFLAPLPQWPKVSVVVCSYNGGKTLLGALESLDLMTYPDFEIILVDDGSKDNSQELVAKFERERAGIQGRPEFVNIVQKNMGLSVARNRGIWEAKGDVVAFTDSDCIADKDWLYYLVSSLIESDCAAVGGPNISPPAHDWIQACVAAAPGSPSHVLLTDTIAEHVPGCNMAYWKWALKEIDGFDPEYRKAGDDVDVCWRLMQRGYQIAFSPSAVVWHHRRFTVQAYFGQQRGYGEAESLLRFKHLVFFGPTGGAKWRGSVYGTPRFEHFFGGPIIYHGAFGMGLFQCIYPRRESEWAGLASSLEWVLLALFIFLISIQVEPLRLVPLIMFGLTLAVGVSWMARAKIEPKHDSVLGRMLLLYLAIAQPLARGWARYMTWITQRRTPNRVLVSSEKTRNSVLWSGWLEQSFWNEKGTCRDSLLREIVDLLEEEGWKYSLDAGWGDWDILVFGNRWWQLRLRTANEYHGGPKVLIRVDHQLRMTMSTVLGGASLLTLILVGMLAFGSKTISASVALLLIALFLIYRGTRLARRIGALVELAAEKCDLKAMGKSKPEKK